MKVVEHVAPQVIPAGLDVTEPEPLPLLETDKVGVFKVKVASTERAWSKVTWQVPVPEHPSPVQPVKVELAFGVAVSVTTVP